MEKVQLTKEEQIIKKFWNYLLDYYEELTDQIFDARDEEEYRELQEKRGILGRIMIEYKNEFFEITDNVVEVFLKA